MEDFLEGNEQFIEKGTIEAKEIADVPNSKEEIEEFPEQNTFNEDDMEEVE